MAGVSGSGSVLAPVHVACAWHQNIHPRIKKPTFLSLLGHLARTRNDTDRSAFGEQRGIKMRGSDVDLRRLLPL